MLSEMVKLHNIWATFIRQRNSTRTDKPTGDFEPLQGQQDNCGDSFRSDFPVPNDIDLIYRRGGMVVVLVPLE